MKLVLEQLHQHLPAKYETEYNSEKVGKTYCRKSCDFLHRKGQ